ncbi:GroES-like protein [Thozetella sp. PMI_491]|nr:GroES-like protein [Thozetella sp. PMI_491]
MIRSRYVGLNPIDWKSVDYNFCLPAFPWVTGREMSGIVEKVGKDVTGIAPGDKVWTSTYYKDVRAGCFQELVVVPTHTVAKIPHTIPFESAACLGVPALTACMTLWKWLNVRMPSQDLEMADWLLIWGGSTSTGQFATQVASQAGLKVITVNSASTKPLSERLGASHVVVRDGKTDAEIVDAIKEATKGGHITRAIDLVGAKTAALVLQAVSAERPVHFAPLAFMSSSQAIPENVTAHTVEMKRFVLDESSRSYADELNALLEAEMLVLPDIHFLDGGFEIIQEGLEMLKRGDLKGKKLVVRM